MKWKINIFNRNIGHCKEKIIQTLDISDLGICTDE